MAETTETTEPPARTTPPASPLGDAPPYDPRRFRRDVLIGAGILLVVLEVGYFLLAREYYRSKLADDLLIGGDEELLGEAATERTKATFFYAYLTFSVVGTAAIAAALLWPRYVAHGLAASFGLVYLGSGLATLAGGKMPPLVGVFQASIGALLLRLAWSSWRSKDRAAWAFLLSMSAVLAGASLFGAPRINAALDTPGLWYVLIIPFVLLAQSIALYRARADYD